MFQFTRPHGARLTSVQDSGIRLRFNSRARMGRDFVGAVGRGGDVKVSIHAPAWGATAEAMHKALQMAQRALFACDTYGALAIIRQALADTREEINAATAAAEGGAA